MLYFLIDYVGEKKKKKAKIAIKLCIWIVDNGI